MMDAALCIETIVLVDETIGLLSHNVCFQIRRKLFVDESKRDDISMLYQVRNNDTGKSRDARDGSINTDSTIAGYHKFIP